MLTYTANELRGLRRFDIVPSRPTRKAIFSYRLWQPLLQRQTQQRESTLARESPRCSDDNKTEGRAARRRRLAAARRRANSETGSKASAATTEPCLAGQDLPSLYVFNAAGLDKMHAIEHLAADLVSYDVDIAVITETHFKSRHTDSVVGVDGYATFRRDRTGRRGGGVALYVRSTIQATAWTYSADDRMYELQWIRVGNTFVGALYHPPKPLYEPNELLDYIEESVGELNRDFPAANIVLAGDLNKLSDEELVERTGLERRLWVLRRLAIILLLSRYIIQDKFGA